MQLANQGHNLAACLRAALITRVKGQSEEACESCWSSSAFGRPTLTCIHSTDDVFRKPSCTTLVDFCQELDVAEWHFSESAFIPMIQEWKVWKVKLAHNRSHQLSSNCPLLKGWTFPYLSARTVKASARTDATTKTTIRKEFSIWKTAKERPAFLEKILYMQGTPHSAPFKS